MKLETRLKARWMEENENGEVDLLCPVCKCPFILIDVGDAHFLNLMCLGAKALCTECGCEFSITENCWKRQI
jgi:hypothetical protein